MATADKLIRLGRQGRWVLDRPLPVRLVFMPYFLWRRRRLVRRMCVEGARQQREFFEGLARGWER